MKKWRRALAASLEEYHKLDCEDFVAGLPCRFKYRSVAPDMFGLRTAEVLSMSDKDLNQVVSLKKLAPYREAEAKPRYGGKRERAEAAMARLQRGGGDGRHRGAEQAAADAAAARAASFVAPTKKARREAREGGGGGGAEKLTKNAAKRLRKKKAKLGKQGEEAAP